VGGLFHIIPIDVMENKIHVPNHQSDFDLFGNELPKCEIIPRCSKPIHH
jgi:hypothetical protein